MYDVSYRTCVGGQEGEELGERELVSDEGVGAETGGVSGSTAAVLQLLLAHEPFVDTRLNRQAEHLTSRYEVNAPRLDRSATA